MSHVTIAGFLIAHYADFNTLQQQQVGIAPGICKRIALLGHQVFGSIAASETASRIANVPCKQDA